MFRTRQTWRPTVFHLVFWSSIRHLINSSSERQRLREKTDTVRNTGPEARQASRKLQNSVNSLLRFSPSIMKLFLPSSATIQTYSVRPILLQAMVLWYKYKFALNFEPCRDTVNTSVYTGTYRHFAQSFFMDAFYQGRP